MKNTHVGYQEKSEKVGFWIVSYDQEKLWQLYPENPTTKRHVAFMLLISITVNLHHDYQQEEHCEASTLT